MKNLTTAALVFLTLGIFISVTSIGVYQILFAIPSVYFSYLAIKDKSIRFPKSSYWLIAFIVVAIISLLVNVDYIPKLSRNFGKLKYFIFAVTGISVFLYWIPQSSDKVKKNLVSLFLVSVSVAAIVGIAKLPFSENARLRGLTPTLRYGYGTALTLLLILSGILHREKIKNWFDYRLGIVAFITAFIAMYLTYTRGAMLGFFCGLPFVCWFYSRKLGLTLGGLSVLIVLTLGGFYLFGSGDYGTRFLVNKNTNSDYIRRSQWKAAVIMTQEKPVLGWGLSNYHSQLKRVKNQYDLDAKHYNDAHAHNVFLEIMAGTGLIGLFLFLGWVITWALECFKAGGMVRAMVVPMGAAWVISSQFEVTLDSNNATLVFAVYAISTACWMLRKNA